MSRDEPCPISSNYEMGHGAVSVYVVFAIALPSGYAPTLIAAYLLGAL